jgi:hypothetical protein
MDYTEIETKLTQHVQSGQIQPAIAFVSSTASYHTSENMVSVALGIEKCPQEVIDAALEGFIKTRQDGNHGSWVHSLSHFTSKLWVLGLKTWIKRLNDITFAGDNKLGASNCSDRLLGDFSQHASWDTVPAEYGYTEENLRWADPSNERMSYDLGRIKASPFKSEAESIRFDLGWPSRFTTSAEWTKEYGQPYMVDVQKVRDTVKKLNELGDDTSDLANVEETIIRQFMATIEKEIASAEPGWNREKRLPRSLELSREMLAAIGK